jgi:chromosomal replication initiator protein
VPQSGAPFFYLCGMNKNNERMKNKKKLEEGSAFVFNPQLDSKKTFLNFIESKNNKVARTMGLSIAENPGQTTSNPYFIFGPNGCGKTHLINAIGISCTEKDLQKRVLYVSAQQFQREFTDSVRQNTTNDFIDYYYSIDLLIVDDIQEWVNAPKTLDAFFHIFNQLLRNGKQIILASNRPPVDLQGMEEYVVKCLACGLVVEIEMPDKQLCINILNAKCVQDGLEIPAEVSEYISKAVNGSVCDLEGIANSLIAYAKVNNSSIDMELAKRVISRLVKLD